MQTHARARRGDASITGYLTICSQLARVGPTIAGRKPEEPAKFAVPADAFLDRAQNNLLHRRGRDLLRLRPRGAAFLPVVCKYIMNANERLARFCCSLVCGIALIVRRRLYWLLHCRELLERSDIALYVRPRVWHC